MEIHKIMNPSAESAQYLFTLVMISLHNSSQHTTSQQVTLPAFCHHIGKVCHAFGKALPMWWQNLANLSARKTKATSLSAKRRKHVLNIIPLTGKRQIGSINGQKFKKMGRIWHNSSAQILIYRTKIVFLPATEKSVIS